MKIVRRLAWLAWSLLVAGVLVGISMLAVSFPAGAESTAHSSRGGTSAEASYAHTDLIPLFVVGGVLLLIGGAAIFVGSRTRR